MKNNFLRKKRNNFKKFILKPKIVKLKILPENKIAWFAISTRLRSHIFIWNLNKTIDIQLVKGDDFFFSPPKSSTAIAFENYEFFCEERQISFRLISNNSENGALVSKLKNYEFILQVVYPQNYEPITILRNKIRSIPQVLTAIELPLTDYPLLEKFSLSL